VELSRRAGEHDHRGAVGGHHEARRGSRRVDRGGPARDHRLLAVRLPERIRVEPQPPREPRDDLGDPLLHSLVEHQLAAGEGRHHLRGQVVGGGPQPAAGDDQGDALRGQEAERGGEVGASIADADDVGHLDAELAQALRDPGPVPIGDSRGQDLGAGDHHPGPHPVPA
jgi:hypothetical protein